VHTTSKPNIHTCNVSLNQAIYPGRLKFTTGKPFYRRRRRRRKNWYLTYTSSIINNFLKDVRNSDV
jgi:hypothetical protein